MPLPIAVPIVGGVVVVGAVALRLRAMSKAKGLPPAPGSANPTAASRAAVANIPPLPPVQKNANGTVNQEDLARQQAAARIRAAQLTTDQLRAIEQNAIPGKTVAEFDGNGTAGSPPLPAGTFAPGDIFPTDHVSINIRAAGLQLPPDVTGDLLIRATALNTSSSIRGVSIDPRLPSSHPIAQERDFPLSAVTGVGPVDF